MSHAPSVSYKPLYLPDLHLRLQEIKMGTNKGRSHSLSISILIVLFSLFCSHFGYCQTQTQRQSQRRGQPVVDSRWKQKGDLELEEKEKILKLTVPPGPPFPENGENWESQILQLSGTTATGVILNPNAVRTKGDDGINDTRGTVRYNILADGSFQRGIITNPAVEDAPYSQASDLKPWNSYNGPIPIEDYEETEVEDV